MDTAANKLLPAKSSPRHVGDDTQSAVFADQGSGLGQWGHGPRATDQKVQVRIVERRMHVSAACSKQMPLGVFFSGEFLIYVIDAKDIRRALRETGRRKSKKQFA